MRLDPRNMSPFALLLRDLRLSRKLRQSELAVLVGYDQTYISALEIDLKGPPTPEFVEKLIGALTLQPEDAAHVRRIARASRRRYRLEGEAPEHVFHLLDHLFEKLPSVTLAQTRVIREVLNMAQPPDSEATRTARRKDANHPRRNSEKPGGVDSSL